METKSIVFTDVGKAELITEELGAPTGTAVQVRVEVSAISSGTERANLLDMPNTPRGQYPKRLGYSCAGVVTAVGEAVTKVAVGDRVAVIWSTHSRYIHIPEEQVFKLPDTVSFSDGALMHIATFPLAAIRKCDLEMGQSAIIMGMGLLGLTAIPLLRCGGAVPVIAVDPVEEKRRKALACGADYALDPYAPDFAQRVKALTGRGAQVGIEVTGVGAGLEGILNCMARYSKVALLGCTRNKEFTIDYYNKVHRPGITLVGAHTLARPKQESHEGWWTVSDDMGALIKLTEAGRLKLSELVDEIHTPEEAPEMYARLARETAFPVVQFDWTGID